MNAGLVLVGGGLANGLAAYRLVTTRPDVDLVVLEKDDALGGDHIWSFHDADLTPQQHRWIAPLVSKSWARHEVRFPSLDRIMESGYHSINSEQLHREVKAKLGSRLRTGAEVREVRPHEVLLDEGLSIEADAVIDGRGDPGGSTLVVAYQKFVGLTLELAREHGLEGPVLMDATVEQSDGFRFMYTLPFSRRGLFVEDTRYSDGPALDRGGMREEIERYAASQGWKVSGTGYEEAGVLPVVMAGDINAFWEAGAPGVPRSGMRAALFHPTTGFSLPEAVRFADDLARLPRLQSEELYPWVRERSMRLWRSGAFFRFLNRMLFRAAEPELRYIVMRRFYRLSERLIHRFYAGRPTLADKIRILTGKPPVPIGRALKCLRESRLLEREQSG
jgi:lycopene beta-cyclase